MPSYRFKKGERLRGRKVMEQLFAEGGRHFHYPLQLRYLESPDSSSDQVAFIVPKRIAKRAVDRNLLRRRLKEIYRVQRDRYRTGAKKRFLLGVIYLGKEIASYSVLEKASIALLKKISEERIEKG